VELKSKVGTTGAVAAKGDQSADATASASGVSAHRDAIAALMALGYKAPDADAAVRQAALALGSKASTEALIKKALS
jgi:Holliday junction DNA helicase RuvA